VMGGGTGETRLTDFEGRSVVRGERSLKISGAAARVTVRWRFGTVTTASVNGIPATMQTGADGPFVEFDHKRESSVAWQ
jgi:hypothetical protein